LVFSLVGFRQHSPWTPVRHGSARQVVIVRQAHDGQREEGANVTIVGTHAGERYRGKNALSAASDVAAKEVSADDFDAVVVPGGWAPDKLRRHDEVTGLVRKAYDQGKIVGLICHAGLVGISAGIV
jgi:protease I